MGNISMPHFVKIILIRKMAILITIVLLIYPLYSQELEPRSLTNVPVGTNFLVFGYGYATGNILLDPALPIEDLDSQLHTFVSAYVRPINFFGMSGKVDVIIPWASGDWEGLLEGERRSRKIDGIGDPRVRLSFNFLGAQAYSGKFDPTINKKNIAGASIQIIVPFGKYDPSKLINLGSNRWTFRTQIGLSHTIGKWIFEGYSGVWIFTPNNDFFSGFKLEQNPLFTFKLHTIYSLPPSGSWIAVSVGYGTGGRTIIENIRRDMHISTLRLGMVYVIPIARVHALKLVLKSGIRFEKGADFDAIALSYQYFWGGD
jgi:hypothetical protein